MNGRNFIGGRWTEGTGPGFESENPATGEVIWRGYSADNRQINKTVHFAKSAFQSWSALSLEKRMDYLERFCEELKKNRLLLSTTIALETGKPLWESDMEVGAMINKLPISVKAYQERCRERVETLSSGVSITRHRPHGVIAVLGPFNFPGHLPNGHIIPALLAGNTVVFKSSELTPKVAEKIFFCWEQAKLPEGVINLIQGGRETGEILSKHPDLNGLMFTGSFKTGHALANVFSEKAGKILALEMGGNNPLVVHEVSDIKAAALQVIQSAYITAGQRCTCARRLIVTKGWNGQEFIEELIKMTNSLKIGPYTDQPEPFMGPLISNISANHVMTAYDLLIHEGAKSLMPLKRIDENLPFLSPGLLDVSAIKVRTDEEIFGPLLQLTWVDDFEAALIEANKTAYGLAAGLLCDNVEYYEYFRHKIKAGIINWNHALTGASSSAPFGGLGHSGNHRPSAYYAADYCVYPVASLEENILKIPDNLPPGIQL
ncbi:MAG TPA: succinylglutamate-semialdehyde dehydrogenase [Gammaproteobacteria bacterium]|nr:succinylglutamate-semialdehyde dehydrogenase [Gammaproteobacteria bacterium]HQZ87948.1 succinylglutamate-semialdehyde dehydrogenase [Gammaproteobacteria bacterium]HRA43064.1 succinylglutamate-semialdehyde dehydrogenase [Gammaproteobacteria bacterium]